jgi:glycosyltransferase involved in cell wall biosynthesis
LKNPIHILHINGSIPSTTFIDNLVNGLSAANVKVSVIGRETGKHNYAAQVGLVKLSNGRWSRMKNIALWYMTAKPSDKKKVQKIWQERKAKGFYATSTKIEEYLAILKTAPDVVHVQWAKWFLARADFFEIFNGKVVVSLRGAHINYTPLMQPGVADIYRTMFPKVHAFHAVSKAIAKEAALYAADLNICHIIYSPTKFVDEALAAKSINKKIKLLSIGRFHWKKGYEFAIQAIQLLKQKGYDVQYDIIAKGDVPEMISFVLDDWGVKENVNIIAGMPHKELMAAYQNYDVFVLPSLEEGIANVAIESMMMGLPVMVTNCGGMQELVEDGVNGLVVPIADPSAIATAIEKYVHMDANALLQMRLHAQQKVKEQFDFQKNIDTCVNMYQTITKD